MGAVVALQLGQIPFQSMTRGPNSSVREMINLSVFEHVESVTLGTFVLLMKRN